MNYIQNLENWTRKSVQDAKLMILLGCLAAIASFLSWVIPSTFNNGSALPLTTLSFFLLLYGGFTLKNRPRLHDELVKSYHKSPKLMLTTENKRIQTQLNGQYKILASWTMVLIAGIASYYLSDDCYYQGMGMGFSIFGCTLLLVDLWSLKRIKEYAALLK